MDLDVNLVIDKLASRISQLEVEKAILEVQNDTLKKEMNKLGDSEVED